MSRFFQIGVLFVSSSVTALACSNGEIGPTNSTATDASAADRAAPLSNEDAARPKPKADASPSPGLHDASRLVEAAVRDARPPRDAGDAGRPFGTHRSDFFGPSRCAAANVELCEDFESGAIDTGTWEVTGNPSVDGAQAARGRKALHVLIDGNGAEYIREKKTFPEPNDTYWGRIFVYFAKLPDAPMTYAHWTFIAASGTGVDGEIRVSGQLQNGGNSFGVGTDNRSQPTGTGDWTISDQDPGDKPVPLNEWLCVEWMHSGSIDETRLFVDGVEHPSLHTTPARSGSTTGQPYLLPEFTNVWVGWQEYQSSTETFELWIDEVAIDASRIGCVI